MLGITEEDLCTDVVIVGTKPVLATLGPPELAVPHSVSLPAVDSALSEQRGERHTPECLARRFSSKYQGSPVLIPWQYAPQPFREASVSMRRSTGFWKNALPFHA